MLFTGKGDDGTTTVFGSKDRLLKDATLIEALGAVDELNSWLGVCKAEAPSDLKLVLTEVQHQLFIVQAELAGAPKTISSKVVAGLAAKVNDIERRLPPIKSFFLPGGTVAAAQLDFARTLARRAERRVVSVRERVGAETKAYLNRLSSLFYALARLANATSGMVEEPPHY